MHWSAEEDQKTNRRSAGLGLLVHGEYRKKASDITTHYCGQSLMFQLNRLGVLIRELLQKISNYLSQFLSCSPCWGNFHSMKKIQWMKSKKCDEVFRIMRPYIENVVYVSDQQVDLWCNESIVCIQILSNTDLQVLVRVGGLFHFFIICGLEKKICAIYTVSNVFTISRYTMHDSYFQECIC